jgi:pimeloyl-ACP methyl ester carboxylesterase/DNA-binding CsgD family transcriptional regulator
MPYSTEQLRFCTSRDGTRIAYAIFGAGPPLVWSQYWIHHLKLDWDSPVWAPWLSMLTRRHTVIRYDFRGCGLSDRENVAFSIEKAAEDLEAVINAVELERFALFGMAGGAAAGITYAVHHPERISHLILYAPYTRNRLAGRPTAGQVEEAQARLKVMELGWPNESPAYGQFFTSLHIPDATPDQFRSYDELLRLTTSPGNAVGLLSAFFQTDLREVVSKVRCPTLVLHARGNAIIPFDEGRKVATLIPGARFVPLESRNHILLETEPAWQQMIDALNDFLPATPPAQWLHELTAREREVLEFVAQGIDNNGIATRLRISEKTVRNHVSIIFSKLGVTSRAQAVALARDGGLGKVR